MAKRGRTRALQGMLLVVLVLGGSLDAGGVMAWEVDAVGLFFSVLEKVPGKVKGLEKWKDFSKGVKAGHKVYKYGKELHDLVAQNAPGDVVDTVAIAGGRPSRLPVFTVDIAAATAVAWTGDCAAGAAVLVPRQQQQVPITLMGRRGTTTVRHLPSATFATCPGGGRSAVLGLGRDGELAARFPTFSYLVLAAPAAGYTNVFLWFGAAPAKPASTALLSYNPHYPSRYYVEVTDIRVDGTSVLPAPLSIRQLDGSGGAYLSTADSLTYLERGAYGRLKQALVQSLRARHGVEPAPPPPPQQLHPDQLCYRRADVAAVASPPAVDVVFNGFNGGAVMNLDAANLFDRGPLYDCLHILPTALDGQVSVLGGVLQSGRPMTIQRPELGGPQVQLGTLTF